MPKHDPLPPELLDQVAKTFQVLSDPSRLEILQLLMAGPKTVSEVVAATGKGQANVSKHLSILANAGILSRTPKANTALYQVKDPLVYKLCDLVCGSLRQRLRSQLQTSKRLLQTS